jgi:hypothetical protein
MFELGANCSPNLRCVKISLCNQIVVQGPPKRYDRVPYCSQQVPAPNNGPLEFALAYNHAARVGLREQQSNDCHYPVNNAKCLRADLG